MLQVEGLRIVRDGLAPTDLVVLNGVGRLQPGAVVTPKRTQIKPQLAQQAAPTAPMAEPQSGQATAK